MSRYTANLTHEQVRKLNIEPEEGVEYDLAWGWDHTGASFVGLFRTVDEPPYPVATDFSTKEEFDKATRNWVKEVSALPDECIFDIGTVCQYAGNDWAAALLNEIKRVKGPEWMPSMTLKLHPGYPDRKGGWKPEQVADLIQPLLGDVIDVLHHAAILHNQPF